MDRDKCKKRKIDGHKCEEKKKEPIKQEAEIEEKKIKAIFEEESDARVKPEEVERLRKRVETVKTENIIQRESYEVEKHKKDKTESEEDRAEVKEIIMKKRKNPHEAQKDEMHCSKKETGNVVESEEHELNKLTQVSKKREERNKEIFQEKNVGTKGEKNIEKKLKTYRGKIEEDESDDELLCLVKMKQCSKDIKNKLTKSVGPKSVIIKSENSNDHFERKNNALLNLNQSVEVVKILNKYSKDSTTLSIKEKKFTQKNLQTLKKVKVVLKRLNLGNYRVSGNLFKSYSIKKVAPTEVKHKNRINLMNLPKLMNKHDVDKKPKDLPNLKCKVQSSTENALKTSKNPKIRYIPKPKSKCLESNIGDANKVKEDEFKCAMIKEIKMEVDLDIKSILKKTCKVTLTKLENDGNINLRTFFKALEKKKGMSKNNNNKIVETVDSSSKSSNTNKFSLVTSSKTSNDDVENEISLESKISDFISSSLSKKMENNSRQIDKSSKIVKSSDKNSSSTTKPKNVDKLIIKNVELSKSFKGKTNSVLSSKKTEKDTRLIVDKSSKLSKHSIPKNCSPTSLSKLDEKIVEKSSEFLKMPNKNRSLLGKETKNDDRLISKNLVPFKSFDVKNDIPSTRRIKNDSKQIDKSLKSIKVSEVKKEKTLSKNKEDELIENNSMLARSFNVSKGSTSSSSDTNIFETRVGKSSESVEDLILKDSSSTKSISSLIKSNKSKFIPGASYIIVNKNESKDKTLSFTYDCVLCSPNKIILMNGTIMKSHLRTKGHLLNVLEVDDYEMYESYKDKMTLDVSELFKEVCHRQNFETIFRNKILTSKNKRQDLIDHILKMRNIKKKDVSKTTMKIQSENCDLLVKHKKFSLIEPPNISGSIIPDFQLFTETLVYKHKGRNPIQIVFALDNTESYIKTEEHAEKIKVIRGKRLNFDNLLDSFKSRDALGKKSLIIILCGIYSVIKAIPLAICKKKKCSNPPSQYSVFPDVSSDYLISKALRIHEYILDHTTNDQVMFCELIPIDLSKEKDDRCNNGHIVRNFLPRNERERYLSIVKDYNSFVLNHTRMIGFKSWNLLNSLYPSRFKQKDGYTSKANTDKEIECSCLLSKILKCKESVKPTDCRTKKQLSSYSERVKCTSPETPEMSHFEIPDFQSFTENLVLKHKTRHPKKIVFTLDSTVSYFRTTDYVEEIKIVRVKNLNFINLISSLKSNNSVGKDSLIIILCGIFSVVKDTPLSICKKMRCPKPLTKYSILPNVSSDYLISSALRIHEYILDHTTNDQVMFCELEPIDLSKDKDIRCAHGHVVRNFLPHKEHERYLSIINEYNSFVANHTRMIGFESWNLLNSLFPSRFKQKHSHASVVNKDKLVENSCLLSKILKNKKEFVNQMHNHPKEQAANSSSDKSMHLLVVGDSEAEAFQSSSSYIKTRYHLTTEVHIRNEMKITNAIATLQSVMRPYHGVVIISALTYMNWKLVPLINGTDVPTVLTLQDNFNANDIAIHMDAIVEFCLSINPQCTVSILIPSIKEMFKYNMTRLKSSGFEHLMNTLINHPLFNKRSMAEASVKAYCRTLSVKDESCQWINKTYILGNHAINRYYDNISPRNMAPHIQYIKGKAIELNCSLLYDGLHYTSDWVILTFKAIGPFSPWLHLPLLGTSRNLSGSKSTHNIKKNEICSSASIKTTSHIGGRFSQETEDFNELKRKKLADGLNASRSSEVLEKLPEVPKIASHSERKKFTKVIIIANHYYAHYVDRFRAPQVEVLTVEISSLNCVLSTIKENCKLQPSCTLWLLPTGIFRIAQTECCHFCWNTYSPCPDPVNVLIPDETVVNEDEDFVENINKSYLDIIMMINSIIGSESSFMVLPAIPPSFMEIEKYYHYEYHKISEINKKKVCYYHMATHDNIERFNKYIIRLDKELTKLAILQCRKINISEYYFECYDEILSQVNYHVQVFYFEDYKRAPIVYKYIEWFECVSKFINYCALQINTPILDIRQETRDLWVSDFNRSVLHNSKQITFDGHHSKENTSAELFKENYNDERINIEISNDRHNYMEIPFDGHYSKENTTDELFFQENFTDELINNKISNDRRNSMEIPFDRHYSKENTTDRPFPNENDTSGLIGKEYTTSERNHGNDSLDKEAISEKFHSDFKAQHEAYLNSVSPPAERKTVKEYTTTSLVLSNTDFLRINDTLFDNAYIIHNEYLSLSSMNQNWKNMNYIYHEMSAKPENDIASIVSKLGDIRPNSVCFLAFNLLVFTKTSVSPECIKFSCPVSLPIININMKRNNEIGFVSVVAMNKMMEIISFATKLSIHVPVVILPLYPTKIYCDDGTYEGHKLIHNALESDTRIVSGERKNWTTFSRVVANLWTSFMKTNYEKYFASEKLESYIKHQYKFLSFQEHYEKSLPCGDVARWDDIFQAFLHILVSDIDRRKGVTSSTGISKFTTDHNLKTVDVVIWNVFESNEGMIFDYFKEMDPKSVIRQCEDHFRIEVPRRNKDKIPETLIKCKARNDEQISCALDDEDASQTFFGKDWKDLVTFGSENSLKFIIRAAKALASQVTKPKEKVFFISPSLKFLKMIKSVVLYVVKETNVRLVLLGEASVDSECFDVFLGVPSTIIDFHWNMLNLLNIQTLIIDDVTKILSNSGDKALLLTIFRRMNIKNNPNLKKMFVADSYDSETTNHLSALFGLPLIEVKEPDTARKWGQVSSKRNEISRLHKPESTPKCYYRKNEQNRRSSFYGSTESRGVPTSKSRKSRSNSRDKRPRSRSRSKSSSKYRERICHSRSRSKSPKRSVTHVRSQKRWKRDDLPTVDRIENTDAEANYEDSPDQLMETLGVSLYKDFVAEKVKLRGIHKGEFDVYFDSPDMHYNYEKFYEEFCIDYNKKYGRNRTDQHKESQWKNYWEKKVESVNKEDWKLKMNELINNYKLKAKDLSSNSKEYITNINSRNSYSNLIEGETSKRNHAPQHSSRTHSRSLSKFDNLQCSQVPLSLYNVGDSRNLEGSSLDFSTKESSSSYISPQSFQSAMVPSSSSTSNYKFSSSSMHYSSHSVENINEAINLLEKVSSKLGMLGLAISAICHSVKQSLNDRNKILILLREEENITILKMAINKLEKLQINAPPSEIPFLSNVVDQTRHLIECAQNTPL